MYCQLCVSTSASKNLSSMCSQYLLYTVNTFYCESCSYAISVAVFKNDITWVSGMKVSPELEADGLKMQRPIWKPL